MKAVMFVCHGNICRSPTAEFVMKDILKRKGKDGIVTVASSATRQLRLSAGTQSA